MSILIKGLKMPTSCLQGGCPVDGSSCQLWQDNYWANYTKPHSNPYSNRHPKCPLVELPDHGDLIDKDAMKASIDKWWREGPFKTACFGEIDDAPVVIPAERRE